MSDSPNYCQHPECHNSHVIYYADVALTNGLNPVRGKRFSFEPMPGARRWCRTHALMNEGVAFG